MYRDTTVIWIIDLLTARVLSIAIVIFPAIMYTVAKTLWCYYSRSLDAFALSMFTVLARCYIITEPEITE